MLSLKSLKFEMIKIKLQNRNTKLIEEKFLSIVCLLENFLALFFFIMNRQMSSKIFFSVSKPTSRQAKDWTEMCRVKNVRQCRSFRQLIVERNPKDVHTSRVKVAFIGNQVFIFPKCRFSDLIKCILFLSNSLICMHTLC